MGEHVDNAEQPPYFSEREKLLASNQQPIKPVTDRSRTIESQHNSSLSHYSGNEVVQQNIAFKK